MQIFVHISFHRHNAKVQVMRRLR